MPHHLEALGVPVIAVLAGVRGSASLAARVSNSSTLGPLTNWGAAGNRSGSSGRAGRGRGGGDGLRGSGSDGLSGGGD